MCVSLCFVLKVFVVIINVRCCKMEEMNQLTVINEHGEEIECQILFTFDSEEYKKNYVVYMPMGEEFEDEDGNPQIHVSSYTREGEAGGNLEPIEDDAEWDMIEEVVDAFIEENGDDEDEPVS